MLEISMTKDAQGAGADLTADLAALRQDVAHLAETMSQAVRHQTQAAGFRVSAAVGDAKDKIASTAAETQNRVRAASREIEASIERNPLMAVLIAFGIGVSLGVISRSRADRA
jgi:ElaB/YqjD/DUF883 family membrane-anchored ribosome-binding protein